MINKGCLLLVLHVSVTSGLPNQHECLRDTIISCNSKHSRWDFRYTVPQNAMIFLGTKSEESFSNLQLASKAID